MALLHPSPILADVRVLQAAGELPSQPSTAALSQIISGSITNCVYNSSTGRLESYLCSGVAHTITWVGNVGTIANETGAPSRVVTLNASGQVVSFV